MVGDMEIKRIKKRHTTKHIVQGGSRVTPEEQRKEKNE